MTSKWQLVSQAFKTWEQLVEARKRTSNTEEDERYQRLMSLSIIAWRRYSRRCRNAMFRSPVRKLLASGNVDGKHAKAQRLYAGVDNGKWRTFSEVGKVMHMSKERVRQLLRPSKVALARILGEGVPWRPVQNDPERDTSKSSLAEAEDVRCCDKPAGIISKSEPHSYDALPAVTLAGVSVRRCQNCDTEVTII